MDEMLKDFLDKKVDAFNQPSFISADPISVPHRFTLQQDIEIAGFFASIFAWGNRTIIIKKSLELMQLFDNRPYSFIIDHCDNDLKALLHFKHRTFNTTDLLYFVQFLRHHYCLHDSLESAFFPEKTMTVEEGLNHFHRYFFSLQEAPERTRKHIAAPFRNSTCKRLNMFLRWMVRHDDRGVDFGIWKKITPAALICPVDLHVARVARKLNLIQHTQTNWQTATDLTAQLRQFDAADPVKYDFALFGLGVMEKF
jgi:uncharacterized protein (TIGR02757 family)